MLFIGLVNPSVVLDVMSIFRPEWHLLRKVLLTLIAAGMVSTWIFLIPGHWTGDMKIGVGHVLRISGMLAMLAPEVSSWRRRTAAG